MRALLASLSALLVGAACAAGPILGVEFTPASGNRADPAIFVGLSTVYAVNDHDLTFSGFVSKWIPYQLAGWWGFGLRGLITTPWWPNFPLGGGVRLGFHWSSYQIDTGYFAPFLSIGWKYAPYQVGVDLWLWTLYENLPLGGPYLSVYFQIDLPVGEPK